MKRSDKELVPLKEALRAAGLRVTPQRMAVYLEMLNSKGHPSVADIHSRVQERLPTVSLDTVYRTLRKLSELGLINPVSSSGDGVRFDSRVDQHHHFICARCGRIIDFESRELDKAPIPQDTARMGEIWDAHMEVRGICSDCLQKSDNRS